MTLFVLFVLIMFDRISYLLRSMRSKVAYHFFNIGLFTIYAIQLHITRRKQIAAQVALALFYAFKVAGLALGALQAREE